MLLDRFDIDRAYADTKITFELVKQTIIYETSIKDSGCDEGVFGAFFEADLVSFVKVNEGTVTQRKKFGRDLYQDNYRQMV